MSDKKTFLYVPFEQKSKAKAYGAKFDGDEKKWYITDKNIHKAELVRMFPNINPKERTYLKIPYNSKDEAKELGARFDGDVKKWYTTRGNPNYDELISEFEIFTD